MASSDRDLESAPSATARIPRTASIGASAADPLKQWERALNVVVAANKFRNSSTVAAAPFHEDTSGSNEQVDDGGQQRLEISNANGLEYLRVAQGGLVQHLNAFGIVFTLLATVTSVSILQPPGSFDGVNGHIRQSNLVACYLMFASLSFLLSCTGLFAVIVGQASLYRPLFFPHREEDLTPLLGFDDFTSLQLIIQDNLSRVRRLKTYLAFSLGMGITAYVCGAFAIIGPAKRNLWMALGTVVVSVVILGIEAVMTWTGPALPDDTWTKLHRIIH